MDKPTYTPPEPVARLLKWEAPKHMPTPHGGVCARTFVEFPLGHGKDGYWQESDQSLYTHDQLSQAHAAGLAQGRSEAASVRVENAMLRDQRERVLEVLNTRMPELGYGEEPYKVIREVKRIVARHGS